MDSLRERREAVVREHMESENRHEFEVTLGTFGHPRYEIIATGEVHDGPDEVMRYFAETRAAFPHLGNLRGLPPTGRAFTCQMLAIFEFESEGDGIVCERVYFDSATIQRQLGIAHDPLTLKGRLATLLNHPVTIARAFLRQARKK